MVDADAFRDLTGHIEERLNAADGAAAQIGLQIGVAAVLPRDDSALQFARGGAGLSANLDETLQQLFERYVEGYDGQSE